MILSSREFGHRRPRGFGSEIAYVFADCAPFSDLESAGSQQKKKLITLWKEQLSMSSGFVR